MLYIKKKKVPRGKTINTSTRKHVTGPYTHACSERRGDDLYATTGAERASIAVRGEAGPREESAISPRYQRPSVVFVRRTPSCPSDLD